jgi:effector-binding domain-containing protein
MGPPPTKAPEGAELRTLEPMKVLAINIRGPYGESESEAIATLMRWMDENAKSAGGPPRVIYMHNPALTNPEDQISEVQIPLAE